MQAIFRHGQRTSVDFTAGADHDAGDVVVTGVLIGVVDHDVSNGDLGSLSITGVFEVVKIAEDDIDPGETVYWDDNGSPVGGVALSGAAASNPELGPILGIAVELAGTDDKATVMVAINQDNAVPSG